MYRRNIAQNTFYANQDQRNESQVYKWKELKSSLQMIAIKKGY